MDEDAAWGGANHDIHIQAGSAVDFRGYSFNLALGSGC
jgi:hypothetical protein